VIAIQVPLAVAEAFAHNRKLTTARDPAAKAKPEISITRQCRAVPYEPDL